jgi:hypothetical protein
MICMHYLQEFTGSSVVIIVWASTVIPFFWIWTAVIWKIKRVDGIKLMTKKYPSKV